MYAERSGNLVSSEYRVNDSKDELSLCEAGACVIAVAMLLSVVFNMKFDANLKIDQHVVKSH